MNPPRIPLCYRLTVRQSVPILAGLVAVLSLLLVMGYLHARQQIVETARLQVSQLMGSIARQDGYSRRWIERGMPPLLGLAGTLPDATPQQRREMGTRIASIISDERGRQTVEICLLNKDGPLWQRRYDSRGPTAPAEPADTTPLLSGWSTQPLQSADEMATFTDPRWHQPRVTENRAITLRYSAPILKTGADDQPAVVGLCTVGLDMPWFAERVRSFSSFENCLVFFMTMDGEWTLPEDADRQLAALKQAMLDHDAGEYRVAYAGQAWLSVFMPLTGGSLHMGVLIPHTNLFGSLDKLTRLLAVCGLVVLVLAAWSLHRTSVRLLAPLPELRDLVGRLARGELEVAAFVHTADEVCGDMYDYFFQSPRRLCCIMGNVTEKGVPAALLMGRIGPLLHELLLSGFPPGKALGNINRMLPPADAQDRSKAPTMISALAGVLDLDSGVFRWASSGQLPPFLCRTDRVEPMEWTGNTALGIRAEEVYLEQETRLAVGESLLFAGQRLLSLSGETEEPYTMERLGHFMQSRNEALSDLLPLLYADIRRTLGREPQDDLTFFAVRLRHCHGAPAGLRQWQH